MELKNITPDANFYQNLEQDLLAIQTGVWITDLANCSALIFQNLTGINWAGFYLLSSGKLVLGPFQGRVACTEIEIGRGVCGQAIYQNKTLVVPDVHEFPGHIACDARSRSEIVIPLVHEGKTLGVLDVDSPLLGRFNSDDEMGLKKIVSTLLASIGKRLAHELSPGQREGF